MSLESFMNLQRWISINTSESVQYILAARKPQLLYTQHIPHYLCYKKLPSQYGRFIQIELVKGKSEKYIGYVMNELLVNYENFS